MSGPAPQPPAHSTRGCQPSAQHTIVLLLLRMCSSCTLQRVLLSFPPYSVARIDGLCAGKPLWLQLVLSCSCDMLAAKPGQGCRAEGFSSHLAHDTWGTAALVQGHPLSLHALLEAQVPCRPQASLHGPSV